MIFVAVMYVLAGLAVLGLLAIEAQDDIITFEWWYEWRNVVLAFAVVLFWWLLLGFLWERRR